jgi:eukaryotic-like serine/threonine-protein kinase
MPPEHSPEDEALCLAPGTRVGAWQVVERQGYGGFGIVYRAVRVGQEHAGSVALKLARHPWEWRFARETELLSRIRDASVPRLLDQGVWRPVTGVEHPYLVMEWVEGTPLYDWACAPALSSEQLPRMVAHLARALAATHAAHAVHRDVKGANILVRHADGRAVLLDFGSGYFRLVTGEYPPPLRAQWDVANPWRRTGEDVHACLERHAQVEPVLREWLVRLLSLRAEERGTALELAEAMEGAATRAAAAAPATGVEAAREKAPSAGEVAPPQQAVRRVPERERRAWRALAAAGLCGLLVWSVQASQRGPEESSLGVLEACGSGGVPEAGTAAVGDSVSSAAPASAHPPAEPEAVAQDPLPKPHPRQVRPDEQGKCPSRKQVEINGACWVEQPPMSAEECTEAGLAYYKGRCYAPTVAPPEKPLPTSSPADSR